jgi:hypothetical protein
MSEQRDRYFARQGESRPEGEGQFFKWDDQTPIEVVPGLTFQPVLGDQLMANFVRFEPHTEEDRQARGGNPDPTERSSWGAHLRHNLSRDGHLQPTPTGSPRAHGAGICRWGGRPFG